MPWKNPHPCSAPGCGNLTQRRFCDKHATSHERQRGSAASRGYGHRWRVYREGYLRAHPFCVLCEREQIVEASTVVDHEVPHRGDYVLMWDPKNHQALCKTHHDRKTATDDRRWG